MSGLENFKTKKLRIFKFDERAEIKKFYFSHERAILVMSEDLTEAFSISLDGSRRNNATIMAPTWEFLRYALVKNELFIFGGWRDYQKVRKFRVSIITESRSRNLKAASGKNNRLDLSTDLNLALRRLRLKEEV